MTLKKNIEFDRDKKFHKNFKSNKEDKYRKKNYDYLDVDDDYDDDKFYDYNVDLDDEN